MAHTEKCRGCMYENACDYIDCRLERDVKNVANAKLNAINEFSEKIKKALGDNLDTNKIVDDIADEMRNKVRLLFQYQKE